MYALPVIVFNRYILSAEICSLFLMLIPFSFIFTQLTERIFDMEYFISRLRYYFNFSFGFTMWLLIGLYLLTDLSITRMTEIFFLPFCRYWRCSTLKSGLIIVSGKFYFLQKATTSTACIRPLRVLVEW